jgi:hypothetical protein
MMKVFAPVLHRDAGDTLIFSAQRAIKAFSSITNARIEQHENAPEFFLV